MNCRLCSNTHLKLKFKVKDHSIYRCTGCGLIQAADEPSEHELSRMYSEDYYSSHKFQDTLTQAKENNRRLALVQRFLPGKGLKLLDFGCGTGDFLTFARENFEMWGHDLSRDAVNKARKNNPDIQNRLTSGGPDNLIPPPDSFDGIVMWDVLEHLPDPPGVCTKLLEYLKPGGRLFLSTPDIGSFTAKVLGKYWAFMTPPEHLAFFSGKSISYLLEKKMNCQILERKTRGKWANAGFFFYKLKRIFPRLVPAFWLRLFQLKYTRNLAFYVPTGDIRYIAVRKPLSPGTGKPAGSGGV